MLQITGRVCMFVCLCLGQMQPKCSPKRPSAALQPRTSWTCGQGSYLGAKAASKVGLATRAEQLETRTSGRKLWPSFSAGALKIEVKENAVGERLKLPQTSSRFDS